ncbi:MAG: glycine--tRNA ligase subunit beta [Proteobacteria bacterium]|nr:glycine--tRNA ligase subunit beta [Pseudomonadota bacterium]MBU1688371.1 glycine--tRNA ligase subunit beta [Pseudomonadota bacterium]
MHHHLLFEIGTEEIPAGYIIPAIDSMKQMLIKKLQELGLDHGNVHTAATPRRLTLGVEKLSARQPDSREEALGPPKAASFDGNNQPTKAAEGFARSRGVRMEEIKIAKTPKGEYLMVVVEKKGQDTKDLLPEILGNIITHIPFPKSMRWATGKTTFARPVQWLLCNYGGEVIPCRINDITSSGTTRGHRFMAPDIFPATTFPEYLNSLRKAHVLADIEERRQAVIHEITGAAKEIGGEVLADDQLILTVTNLVEEPHAVCGSFDQKFLALPKEVLITSMREHQKYFAVISPIGALLPNFIAVNNTATRNRKLAVDGHQRVLRARLEDALFFYKEDCNHPLADRIDRLSGVVFQAGLGTMLEKSQRLAKLTGWLASRIEPTIIGPAVRAATLAKADLLTEMVGEFPTLQGIMGRNYAIHDGEGEDVALAIAEHYLPVRAGSELPTAMTGALVSLADRIDTICGCFGIGKHPTGTTDPYGLRRLALGFIHIIKDQKFAFSLSALVQEAIQLYGAKITAPEAEAAIAVIDFIKGRFINDLTAGGTPIATVEAVTEVSFDDLLDCRKKIEALIEVQEEKTFTILAGSFKRVKNIIKDHQDDIINEELLLEPAEKALYTELLKVREITLPLLAQRDYRAAMTEILKMKEPVDHFFEKVMVMADDEKLKNNRLGLLCAIARLFLQIGDFSRMSS